ncbi:MAG TPA: NfeD family protein [Steroidobacteraceae bacterium]|jgi:membrane protein implicated in regulation of membrane protease activity|nr:NfeD family protein [Steroidobacteraceae bacterium]
MQWWAWIAVGAILLVSELAFIDAQFYLVFVGSAALVVGFLALAGVADAIWLQWLIFAALTVVTMVTFRRRVYERLRRNLPVMHAAPVGESLVLPTDLAPGNSCRLEFRGSTWTAVNGGESPIDAGGRARVDRVDGVTLVVRRAS